MAGLAEQSCNISLLECVACMGEIFLESRKASGSHMNSSPREREREREREGASIFVLFLPPASQILMNEMNESVRANEEGNGRASH